MWVCSFTQFTTTFSLYNLCHILSLCECLVCNCFVLLLCLDQVSPENGSPCLSEITCLNKGKIIIMKNKTSKWIIKKKKHLIALRHLHFNSLVFCFFFNLLFNSLKPKDCSLHLVFLYIWSPLTNIFMKTAVKQEYIDQEEKGYILWVSGEQHYSSSVGRKQCRRKS